MPERLQNILLVVLAVVTAVAVWFAFSATRSADVPLEPGEDAAGPTPVATPTAGDVDDATATTGGADAGVAGDDAAATTGSQDDDATTDSPQDAQEEAGDPLETARQALASGDDVVLSVLGDSTSNSRSEWVHLWAEDMAEDRPVSILHWMESSGDGYNEPDVLSEEGDDGAVTIYSGSVADASAAYPATRIGQMVPEEPAAVLLSYGHANTADDIGEELDETAQALEMVYPGTPVIVVLQNPTVEDREPEVREAAREWAEENGAGVIDVAAEFDPAGWPLLGDDDFPSDEGHQLWAQTVDEALRG